LGATRPQIPYPSLSAFPEQVDNTPQQPATLKRSPYGNADDPSKRVKYGQPPDPPIVAGSHQGQLPPLVVRGMQHEEQRGLNTGAQFAQNPEVQPQPSYDTFGQRMVTTSLGPPQSGSDVEPTFSSTAYSNSFVTPSQGNYPPQYRQPPQVWTYSQGDYGYPQVNLNALETLYFNE